MGQQKNFQIYVILRDYIENFLLKRPHPAELIHFLNNLKYIKKLNQYIQNDEILKTYISQPNLSSSNKKIGRHIEKNIYTSLATSISTTSF